MSKKKKILTITCHNVYNHGASLQEYALLKFLENEGFEAATINYTPDYLSGHFNFLSVDNPKFRKNLLFKLLYLVLKSPSKLFSYPRKIKFDNFSKKFIPETKERYTTNEDLKTNLPNADIYICGSDQIWNSYFQNGKDPAFYLDFVSEEKIKIAYAPSFAIDKLEEDIKSFVKAKVERLDAVSVRESSGKRILNELGIKKVTHVLDPVFLLPKKEWDKLCVKSFEKDYILVYDFDNNPKIKKIALNLKKENNWKIITLNKNVSYADTKYFLKGPQEFLTLVKYAKYILASSFHAVTFSLIFQKEFLVFNRKDKINTRMRDLLIKMNIKERLVTDKIDIKYNNFINYKKVNNLLDKEINNSKKFLIENISQ